MPENSKKLETEPLLLGDFQSYFQETSVSSNLLIVMKKRHWDNSIEVVIILNNEHCFKEDPEHGQTLTRWSGDLSKEDCQKPNTRVIRYKDLKLPATSKDKQSVINHLIPI